MDYIKRYALINALECAEVNTEKRGHDATTIRLERKDIIEITRDMHKADKYRWHDLRKNPEDLPVNEDEVEIAYIGFDRKIYTARAFYEDGTMHSENSMMSCLDWLSWSDWCEYCEETDDWIIPKCWLEYVSFGDTYTEIDKKVIAWREIEPFEEE